jgi:hypothetical protein
MEQGARSALVGFRAQIGPVNRREADRNPPPHVVSTGRPRRWCWFSTGTHRRSLRPARGAV